MSVTVKEGWVYKRGGGQKKKKSTQV